MAELLVVMDPAHARPRRPIGSVVMIAPNGFAWGSEDRRDFLVVRVTNATVAQARAAFMAHEDWEPEDGPPPTLRRFKPSSVPAPIKNKVRAYVQRKRDVAEQLASAGRAAFRAELVRRLRRALTQEELGLRTMRLLRRFRKRRRVYHAIKKAHSDAYRAKREELCASLPMPPVLEVTRAQALAASEVVTL